MSEQSASSIGLSLEQQSALRKFRRRFGRVEPFISTCLFGAGLFFVLILWTSAQSTGWLLWVGVGLILSAAIYPLVLFGVTKSRTGLMWHTLNARSEVLVHPIYGLLTFFWLVLLVRSEVPYSSVAVVIAVLMVVNVFLSFGIEAFSQRRAQAEREHYGDHWLKLGELSFWDIFFLRIPHERA